MTPLISSRAGGKDDFGFADAEVEVPAESKEGRGQFWSSELILG